MNAEYGKYNFKPSCILWWTPEFLSRDKKKEHNYWALRRKDFKQEVNNCNVLLNSVEKFYCYGYVRYFEKNKTYRHENEYLKNKVNSLQQIVDSHSRSTNY